ncbi:MAG: IS3 family transposase [Algisphaera sp.]
MKFAFIQQHANSFADWTVTTICRVVEASRNGYYDWLKARSRPLSPRRLRVATLSRAVESIFKQFKSKYGAPRVHKELIARGESCDRKTVARLMQRMSLVGKGKKKFRIRTTDSNHEHPIAPDLVQRDFTAAAPNQVWVTDLTYIATQQGWLYCVVILDLFSRRIVAHAEADHMRADLVIEALTKAIRQRKPAPGLVLHSDRGVQFASDAVRDVCRAAGIRRSMSGKGDCYDNAVAESFFSRMKTEELNDHFPESHSDAKLIIFEFIEGFYNTIRRHSFLDYVSPDHYESLHKAKLAS